MNSLRMCVVAVCCSCLQLHQQKCVVLVTLTTNWKLQRDHCRKEYLLKTRHKHRCTVMCNYCKHIMDNKHAQNNRICITLPIPTTWLLLLPYCGCGYCITCRSINQSTLVGTPPFFMHRVKVSIQPSVNYVLGIFLVSVLPI